MKWQALLLEPVLLAALAGSRSGLLANRTGSAAGILVILAACLGGVATLAFLAGGYVWLESVYGMQFATLMVGMVTAGLAVVLLLVSGSIGRYKRMRVAAYQSEVTRRIEAVTQAIMSEIEEPVKAYPKTAVSLAALAGYVAGDRVNDGTETIIRAFDKLRTGAGQAHH